MNPMIRSFRSHPKRSFSLTVAALALSLSGISFAVSGFTYLRYAQDYDQGEAALKATFPQKPEALLTDNDYVTYDSTGGVVLKTKSPYAKAFTYYARDAVVEPLSQEVAEIYEKIDDSALGECINGLDRRGGAISFVIRAPQYGLADIDIALASDWYDETGTLHAMANLTDYIKLQINGLELQTSDFALPESGEYTHLVLKNTPLLKGENTLTFTTSAYNNLANKDDVLYVMPRIRNLTAISDIALYTPVYSWDLSTFKSDYALYELVSLEGIVCTKSIGEKGVCYTEETLSAKKLNATIDYAARKITIRCAPKEIKEIGFALDESPAANTLAGQLDGTEASLVLVSRERATLTSGGVSCAFAITLRGSEGLASIVVGERLEGDETLYAKLGGFLNLLKEDDGVHFLCRLNGYYRTSVLANSENQNTDTFFYFGDTEGQVELRWKFTYSSNNYKETLVAKYEMDNGEVHLTEKVSDSVYQWDHIRYRFALDAMTPCAQSDLPF